jgi:hypothetical protein
LLLTASLYCFHTASLPTRSLSFRPRQTHSSLLPPSSDRIAFLRTCFCYNRPLLFPSHVVISFSLSCHPTDHFSHPTDHLPHIRSTRCQILSPCQPPRSATCHFTTFTIHVHRPPYPSTFTVHLHRTNFLIPISSSSSSYCSYCSSMPSSLQRPIHPVDLTDPLCISSPFFLSSPCAAAPAFVVLLLRIGSCSARSGLLSCLLLSRSSLIVAPHSPRFFFDAPFFPAN